MPEENLKEIEWFYINIYQLKRATFSCSFYSLINTLIDLANSLQLSQP